MKRDERKNEKRYDSGITLVALVVTIIVLLILAGVSLSLVAGGNGIINKADTATSKTRIGSAKEQLELQFATLAADYYEAKYVNNADMTGYDNARAYIESRSSEFDVSDATVSINSHELTLTVNGEAAIKADITEEGKLSWK